MFPIADTVPLRSFPIATWCLISANALMFAVLLGLEPAHIERLFYLFGIVPARYTHPRWAEWVGLPADDLWPLLTSQFLHAGWLHLFSNMWVLWLFGDNVEDRMGTVRFVAFYLSCGVAAGLVHGLTNPDSTVPAVGASGAVAGVIAAYAAYFPRAQVVVLVPVLFYPLLFAVHALVFAAVWFLAQAFSGVLALAGTGAAGGVAWWAHVGGFIAGLALAPLLARRRPGRDHDDRWALQRAWAR